MDLTLTLAHNKLLHIKAVSSEIVQTSVVSLSWIVYMYFFLFVCASTAGVLEIIIKGFTSLCHDVHKVHKYCVI